MEPYDTPSVWSLAIAIILVVTVLGVGMYLLGIEHMRTITKKRQQLRDQEEEARFQKRLAEYQASLGLTPATGHAPWSPERTATYRRHGSDG